MIARHRVASTRWRAAIVLILAFVVMFASHAHADTSTSDALDAIDAVPSSVAATPHSHAAPAQPITDWVSLISFFAPGLIVAASIGAAGGVFGAFVLLRRDALVALALPQVVAVGAAVGMRAGWPTLPPALALMAAAVAFIVASRWRGGASGSARGDAAIAPALYVAGLCVSFLVIAHGGQHVEELQNLFTGIDVAVTPGQAWIVAPVLLAVAAVGAMLWRRWLLIAQAPATAELARVSVRASDALFLALLATVLLVGTNAQGAAIVLAMLFLPPAIVAPWARRLPTQLALGVAAAWLALGVAFYVSVTQQWPLSQSLGGVAFAGLLISRTLARALIRA